MEHFNRDYTLGDISQSLINPSYSVLRNLLLFSFKKIVDNNFTKEKPDPRVMTDLLIYFMSVEQEQIFIVNDINNFLLQIWFVVLQYVVEGVL